MTLTGLEILRLCLARPTAGFEFTPDQKSIVQELVLLGALMDHGDMIGEDLTVNRLRFDLRIFTVTRKGRSIIENGIAPPSSDDLK